MTTETVAPTEMADLGNLSADVPAEALLPSSSYTEALLRFWEMGGPVAALLILMSVVALGLILSKGLQFQRLEIGRWRGVRRAADLYHSGDTPAAVDLLAQCRNPAARCLDVAIAARISAGPASPEERADILGLAREEVVRLADATLHRLRAKLKALEVIAALSPLLGLLGTVLGMIAVFQDIAAAETRVSPALLSGGIWEALLTTAIGMAVAIPAIVAVNWIESRIERFTAELENLVTRVFTAPMPCRSDAMDSFEEVPLAEAAE